MENSSTKRSELLGARHLLGAPRDWISCIAEASALDAGKAGPRCGFARLFSQMGVTDSLRDILGRQAVIRCSADMS